MCASLRVQTLRNDALFSQTPAYLLQKEPRSARGLPAMSSLLGVVRKQLKSHPALIPLFIFIGGGATMSMLYLSRLALKNPDVSWDRKNNPEPWNKMEPNQQYKLFAVNMDYSKLKKDRPDF